MNNCYLCTQRTSKYGLQSIKRIAYSKVSNILVVHLLRNYLLTINIYV